VYPFGEIPDDAENAFPASVGEKVDGYLGGEGGAVFTAMYPFSRIASPVAYPMHQLPESLLKRPGIFLKRGGKMGGPGAAKFLKRREFEHFQGCGVSFEKKSALHICDKNGISGGFEEIPVVFLPLLKIYPHPLLVRYVFENSEYPLDIAVRILQRHFGDPYPSGRGLIIQNDLAFSRNNGAFLSEKKGVFLLKERGVLFPGHGKVRFPQEIFMRVGFRSPEKRRISPKITGVDVFPENADGNALHHRPEHLMSLLALLLHLFPFRNILDISGNPGNSLGGEFSLSMDDHPSKPLVGVEYPKLFQQKGGISPKNLPVSSYHPVGILFPEAFLEKIENICGFLGKSQERIDGRACPGRRAVQGNLEKSQAACTRRQGEGFFASSEFRLRSLASEYFPGKPTVPDQGSSKQQQYDKPSSAYPGKGSFPGRRTLHGKVDPTLQNHFPSEGREGLEKTIDQGEQRSQIFPESYGGLCGVGSFEGRGDVRVAFHFAKILVGSSIEKSVCHLFRTDSLQHSLGRVVKAEGEPRIGSGEKLHRPGRILDAQRRVLDVVKILDEGTFHMPHHQSAQADIGERKEKVAFPFGASVGGGKHIHATSSGGFHGFFPTREVHRSDVDTQCFSKKVYIACTYAVMKALFIQELDGRPSGIHSQGEGRKLGKPGFFLFGEKKARRRF
jgi:hypothetical protein